MKRTFVVVLSAISAIALATPAHAARPLEKPTLVIHGDTFSVFFPDDICGPRASTTTFTFRTQVLHGAERPDGTYNFHFTDTGTYHVDFVDPALQDQDSQFTETSHHVRTRGETEVLRGAFHDFPTGIRIWERFHATAVDGVIIVDREIVKVTGCP
jgi:hypothetical protein